jgi:hypothetical protein
VAASADAAAGRGEQAHGLRANLAREPVGLAGIVSGHFAQPAARPGEENAVGDHQQQHRPAQHQRAVLGPHAHLGAGQQVQFIAHPHAQRAVLGHPFGNAGRGRGRRRRDGMPAQQVAPRVAVDEAGKPGALEAQQRPDQRSATRCSACGASIAGCSSCRQA